MFSLDKYRVAVPDLPVVELPMILTRASGFDFENDAFASVDRAAREGFHHHKFVTV
jgi:hypothetical protein